MPSAPPPGVSRTSASPTSLATSSDPLPAEFLAYRNPAAEAHARLREANEAEQRNREARLRLIDRVIALRGQINLFCDARDIRRSGRYPDLPDPELHVAPIRACVCEFVAELRKFPVAGKYSVVGEWWNRQGADHDTLFADADRSISVNRPATHASDIREVHKASFAAAYRMADLWFRCEVSDAALDLVLHGDGLYWTPRYLDALLGRLEDDLRRADLPAATAAAEPTEAELMGRSADALQGWSRRCGGLLHCSPGFGTVRRHEAEFHLTPNQRNVIEYMVGRWEKGHRQFTNEQLVGKSGGTADHVRDIFRSNGRAVRVERLDRSRTRSERGLHPLP